MDAVEKRKDSTAGGLIRQITGWLRLNMTPPPQPRSLAQFTGREKSRIHYDLGVSSRRGRRFHGHRLPREVGRGKGVAVPAQIGRQPMEDAEAAGAVFALEPLRRHLADPPTEAMAFHQQLDA